jgi:CDK-activating kinase assembly factor MAT1
LLFAQLSEKSLEETQTEKDFALRRKLKTLFNKTEADFASKEAYKDYEELVEDSIYNLVHSIDVEATKAAIESYRHDNTRLIAINQMKANEILHDEISTIQKYEEMLRNQEKEFRVYICRISCSIS